MMEKAGKYVVQIYENDREIKKEHYRNKKKLQNPNSSNEHYI